MNIIEGICIMAIDLGFVFVPLLILTAFAEETKLGRRLTRWVLMKLDAWDPDWDEEEK